MALPAFLAPEVGYALFYLTNPSHGNLTGPEILDRIEARGNVRNRDEARQVLAQARANVAAHGRITQASVGQSLRSACGYKCDPSTPIALRIRVDATDASGQVIESRSIVINARASDNLQFVLDRAREAFNRRYRRGTTSVSGQLRIDRQLTPADVDQVLLDYTQGSVWA